jgi:quercetin dioxygenase-like cupin family protein
MEVKLSQHMLFAEEQVACEILHSCQDMRVVLFNLLPGQEVPPATSSSSVCFQVVSGEGRLLCGSEWVPGGLGTIRFYPPGELHGIRGTQGKLSILATYTPRP